jgi:hypothetical protein
MWKGRFGSFELQGETGSGEASTWPRLLILRSFIKKTQKTPRMEIEIALKRLSEVE